MRLPSNNEDPYVRLRQFQSNRRVGQEYRSLKLIADFSVAALDDYDTGYIEILIIFGKFNPNYFPGIRYVSQPKFQTSFYKLKFPGIDGLWIHFKRGVII